MAHEYMDVAAAIILREGRVLITQRPKGSFMAGKWEFPGGKVERGEDPKDAVAREVFEELKLDVRPKDHFHTTEHVYWLGENKRTIKLMTYLCEIIKGRMACIGCQDFRWVAPEELKDFDFVDADVEVVEKLAYK